VVDQHKIFFSVLGRRIKKLRKKRRLSQEDMISYGFSARHWQQIEKGRPITVMTLLRICSTFKITLAKLVNGLEAEVKRGVE
jgi:transcriptional regulator with XRE-family HTH domain